jgi:prophage antirepressor-like protein
MEATLPGVKTFQYRLQDGPAVDRDGEPWFVETDVRHVLGLRGNSYHRKRLLDTEKGAHVVGTPGGPQAMHIVSETAVYTLIMRNDTPEVQPFQTWVAEVIKEVRKTGRYELPVRLAPEPALTADTSRRELAVRAIAVEVNLGERFGIPRIPCLQARAKLAKEAVQALSEKFQINAGYSDAFICPRANDCPIKSGSEPYVSVQTRPLVRNVAIFPFTQCGEMPVHAGLVSGGFSLIVP